MRDFCGTLLRGGRVVRWTARGLLIVAMLVGSVAVWTAIPVAGLWVASQLSDSFTEAPMGPYLVAALGIPLMMGLAGRGLGLLGGLYDRLTGVERPRGVVPIWRRSLRDAHSASQPTTRLERLMIVSVLIAWLVMAVWFFGFAGSPIG